MMKLSTKKSSRTPQYILSRFLILVQKRKSIARKMVNTPQYTFGRPSFAVGWVKATEFAMVFPIPFSTPAKSGVTPMFTANCLGKVLSDEWVYPSAKYTGRMNTADIIRPSTEAPSILRNCIIISFQPLNSTMT